MELWLQSNPLWMFFLLFLGFIILYFGITGSFYLFGKWFLHKGWLIRQNVSSLFPNQIAFEMKNSFKSILIFSLYGLFIHQLDQNGYVHFELKTPLYVSMDLLLLALWNELHFYLCHRLMHSKYLRRFHAIHHRSVVVTPFSTYSFHPLESILNGSVMILFILIYPISILSFVIFPIYHLFFNTMGHTNLRLKENKGLFKQIFISGHHMLHHKKGKVNFSFVTHFFDRIFKTYSN